MPRLNVIVLDQTPTDPNTYRVVFWADVPMARQTYYANAAATSAWKDATAADNQALQNGSVVENTQTWRVTAGSTLAQIEAHLQTQWQAYQTYITNFNPWIHYGSTWDGTTWIITSGA
jgi:hypothetical protein